jgi:hypothetical protein
MRVHKECSMADPHPPMLVDYSSLHSGHRTISDFLDQGCRDDVDAKNFKFLYACSVPFNVLFSPIGMNWYKPSMVPLKDKTAPSMTKLEPCAPKGKNSPEYDKARTLGHQKERAKIHSALGKFKKLRTIMGYQLYLMVGEMFKAIH